MKKNTSASLSNFVDDVYILKALTRYNNKFKIISESVAEHSYFVAVLTLKMHDDYNFNLEEALKMALIHDIPELHLSDVTHDVKRNFPKLAQEVTNAEYVIMKNGAKKYIYLNVSSAFHSRLMKNAEEKMKSLLKEVNFHNSSYYIISNFSAKETKDSKIIYNNLTKQMSNKVRWVESIKCLENLNESKIIEIGPGNVLSGLVRRISNKFTLFNINSVEDLYNFVNEV